MSRGVNKVILVGHLGNVPENRQIPNGGQVTNCSLATNRVWTDNTGQRQEKTEWHRLVFFNRLAEIAAQYLTKGRQIYVEGELRTNKWEKDGITRYTTEIIVREMQMLGSGNQQNASYDPPNAAPKQQGETQTPSQNKTNSPYEDKDDDIPF